MTLYAERVGGVIETNATHSQKELMRSIPGARFNSPPPTWTVPLTWAACKQLRGTFGASLEVGPGLMAWAEAELARRVAPSLALRDLAVPEGRIPLRPPGGLELRPFQEADVLWMLSAGSGLLMNIVGAGKTISVLTWMRNLALDRVLVICPAAMKQVWAEEARLWYPELDPTVVAGPASKRRAQIEDVGLYGGLALVNFESVRTHSRLAAYGQVRLSESEKAPKELNLYDWDAVVVDEAHRLADPKSKQTRACWAVGESAGLRWALTATPTTRGLDTLWPALHFVDPVEHPARSRFVDRYCQVATNFWGGVTVGAVRPEMEAEFLDIFRPRSRALPREVALPQLPPLVRVVKTLEMDGEQARAYRQMAELSLAELEGGGVVAATTSAARYTRLGQFASSFARLEPKGDEGEYTVELNAPSNKIDAFMEDLKDWLAQDEAVLAFASSRRLIELLSATLTKKKVAHAKIVGGQSEMERHEQIQAFQRGEVDVILVVIAAGGAGITLARGRVMAFLQRSWSKVDDRQAEGRAYRIGSEVHDSVLRVDYVTEGTVDVGQLDVLEAKDELMRQVLQDRETIRKMILGGHPAPTQRETGLGISDAGQAEGEAPAGRGPADIGAGQADVRAEDELEPLA